MRKLKLQVQISVNGFIAGTNGEMDWMVWNWDQALNNYVGEITEPVDCIILGRKLAEGFIPYWASNPGAEGAEKMNSTPKVVFSKTLRDVDWKNTTLDTGDLVDEIADLKKKEGGDMIVYGGANFISSLIRNGLIDEYHLFINPVAISTGLPIFGELQNPHRLKLVSARSFDCGIVVLHYQPIHS